MRLWLAPLWDAGLVYLGQKMITTLKKLCAEHPISHVLTLPISRSMPGGYSFHFRPA